MAPDAVKQGVLGYERSRRPRECAQNSERLWGERYRLAAARQASICFIELKRIKYKPQRIRRAIRVCAALGSTRVSRPISVWARRVFGGSVHVVSQNLWAIQRSERIILAEEPQRWA